MTLATFETAPLPDRMEYAQALASASLIPQAFRNRPADVLVAIEYGNALGIAPIVALSEINVISGTPSLSASLMAALARQAGHKVRITVEDNTATCEIVRADDPDFTHRSTWDESKARAAGLWGKGHWGKDPGTMLRWRAVSECVRFACSEVLGGLKYSSDEVRDFSPEPSPVQHQVTQVPPSIKDMIPPDEYAEHAWEPAAPEKVAADREPPHRTEAQAKKLAVLMRKLGMDNRDESLALFSGLIGRDLTTTKDLSVPECSMVIDELTRLEADGVDVTTGEVVEP